MAESKPRKLTRKTKIEKLAEEPAMPIRRAAASRKSVRRLPPSPGMDDIALPPDLVQDLEVETGSETDLISEQIQQQSQQDSAAMELENIEKEDYLSLHEYHAEQINQAQSAVNAENLHGTLHPQASSSSVNETKFSSEEYSSREEASKTFTGKIESKPRVVEPFLSREDTNFLAPDYNSFGLSVKKSRGGFTTFIIWLLGILIVIGIAVLVLLYAYPTQSSQWFNTAKSKIMQEINSLKHQASGGQAASQSSGRTPVAVPVSKIQFRTASGSAALAAAVDSSIQSGYSDYQVVSNSDPSEVSSLNLTQDTLLYKSSEQPQAQEVSSSLAQNFGLQVNLQANDNLQEDVLLYLVQTLSNPNLNGATSIVYNANGSPGAAKTYCQILTGYKASSCTASNSKTSAQGIQVLYKNVPIMFILARTPKFSNATFQQAPAAQQEDIAVTLGK